MKEASLNLNGFDFAVNDGIKLYSKEGKYLCTFRPNGFELVGVTVGQTVRAEYISDGVGLTAEYSEYNGMLCETLTLTNNTDDIKLFSGQICGFEFEKNDGTRFSAIPFRRRGEDGKLMDWNAEEFESGVHDFFIDRNYLVPSNRRVAEYETAEGFALYGGGKCFLAIKHAATSLEWMGITSADRKIKTGSGVYRLGDPEAAGNLTPHSSFTFEKSYYTYIDGRWKDGYKAFRDFMDGMGHTVPENYSPRLHWNELYDNKYWYEIDQSDRPGEQFWHRDVTELVNKYYHREDMLKAAETGYSFGCETLYLDPGWDTLFGSNIWDESRMGDMRSFADEIKAKYGMTLALHAPLAPWTDRHAHGEECLIRDENGNPNRDGNICVISKQYIKEKIERLVKLCDNGATMFLYDGSWWEGPCYDKNHGHSAPSTRAEHIKAINDLSRLLHQKRPSAIIEQHDPITGPGIPRYTPVCCNMKTGSGDADEIWAFEFMNNPLDDFSSGRAYVMYYLNLAYRQPFYLHIDLRFDNENCLSFWWFASTCRHMGIGGTEKDERKLELQKKQVHLYCKYSEYYKKGIFYGINEDIHAHTIGNKSVIDLFNPTAEDKTVSVTVCGKDIGVDCDGHVNINANVKALGHTLVFADFSDSGTATVCEA